MSFEVDLRARLKADNAIGTIIGTKSGVKSIDWDERPQGAPYPSIVLTTIFADHSQHMAGFNHFQPTRTQFRCTAQDRATAIALRTAVIACIAPEATQGDTHFLRTQGINHTARTQPTETGTLHHEFVDAEVWHGAAT